MKKAIVKNRWLKEAIAFAKRLSDAHVPAYSAQASFFIMISSVPFAMLLISFLQMFLPNDKSAIIGIIENFAPEKAQNLLIGVTTEFYSNVSFPVLSITTIVLLWSASKGVKAMVSGLKNVYKTVRPTDFITNIVFSILYTLVFVAVLVATVIILLFGQKLNMLLFNSMPIVQKVIENILQFCNLFFLLPLTLFFAASYKLLAKNSIPFVRHFYGAVFSALGWMLFSFFFSLYIENFANYSYIYGSLTAVVLLMLWLYVCMNIFLIGAIINIRLYRRDFSIKGMVKNIFLKLKSRGKTQ